MKKCYLKLSFIGPLLMCQGLFGSAMELTSLPVAAYRITLPVEQYDGFAFPADKSPVYSGGIAAIDGFVIEVQNTPLWDINEFATDTPYGVLMTSDFLEGAWFEISSNTDTAIEIAHANFDLSLIESGDTFVIQPAWTLDDVAEMLDLPDQTILMVSNGAGITGGYYKSYTYSVANGWDNHAGQTGIGRG